MASHADTAKIENGKSKVSRLGVHGDKYLEKFGLRCMGRYNDTEIVYRLKNYRKIMTVRDPLLRAFSSYREKLAHIKPPKCQMYQRGLGVKILKKVRGSNNLTELERKCGYTVTFPEFVKYLSSGSGAQLLQQDPHWNKYHKMCFPCMIDYDYYIRLETGNSDQRMFLEEYLHSKLVPLFTGNKLHFQNLGKASEERLAASGYTQLETAFVDVNRTEFDIIYNHYRVDSLLFGYKQSLSEDGLTSSCRASAEHDERQCC